MIISRLSETSRISIWAATQENLSSGFPTNPVIDTIKYNICFETPCKKVTKIQENITHKRTTRSALSEQLITRLQGTDKTVYF